MGGLRDTFAEVLHELGKEDPNLVVLVGDISHYRLQPFAEDCPGRYYNIGICEPTIVSMAAGLSKAGFFPVVHTISPFIVDRSFEQIKLDFCYQKYGGNFITAGSAFDYAALGCTHHCYGDFGILKTLPRTQLVYPASDVELTELLRQTYNNEFVTYFRAPMHGHSQKFSKGDIIFGKGIKIKDGKDLTIIAVGSQLETVLNARPRVKEIADAEILYIHTVKPLDADLVRQSLRKTGRCLVIEEHSVYGGVFDDVLRAARDLSGTRYSSIAIPNEFIHQYGTYQEHCQRLGFSVDGIIGKIKDELL